MEIELILPVPGGPRKSSGKEGSRLFIDSHICHVMYTLICFGVFLESQHFDARVDAFKLSINQQLR